ncbi:isochorismatase family protein [Neurospora crassa OR74A]|uniref:Isochorismatase family protein n=1 Tax=Neurospora crassa (strain ATCC 24698 / 74-OR23-1A / CBS 708.71 / DSM 1257 / FGSC 987) TaxID=367110 RepID=Q7S5N6_NEUCR|nr:isochorismatase family protein [Neurospora crassa OR74A]EAA30831.1 isochorismatase family protein [Neurospora crassa OR74A]|eukprot:XP_960067.1 isochorismatase family protein [Neurospora crassa OR74A]
MFPINVAAMPALPTRKALIVVDLQNDFVSPDGALPVTKPDGFVDRILELVKIFRDSGAGDVVWVRSEFEQHRALDTEGDTIIASDIPMRPSPTRRRANSKDHDGKLMGADEEAFLTVVGGLDKPACVRKGTPGANFPPNIEASIMRGRDFITTKSHYSAFPPGQSQLVQQLRMRFVTDMYVCGSLTNVGVFATALEAGKHAYDITIVEDCCGYRSYARHVNAVQQLEKLTGCDLLNSSALIDKLQPTQPRNPAKRGHRTKPSSGSRDVKKPGKAEESKQDRDRLSTAPPKASTNHSTGLSPTMARVSIDLSNLSPIEPLAPSRRTTNSGSSTTPQPRQATSNANVPLTQPMVTHGDLSNPLADSLAPLEAASEADTDNIESEVLSIKRRNVGRISQSLSGSPGVLGAKPVDGADSSPSSQTTRVAVKPRLRRDKTSTSSSSSSPSHFQGNDKDRNSAEALEQIKDTPSTPAISNQPDPNTPQSSTDSPESHTKTSSTTTMENYQKLTVSEPLCEGDTTVITNALSPDLAADAFERLLEEVSWAGMSHLGGEVPRRIAVQGAVDDEGNMPVYRHPADESPPLLPFSPTVLAIKNEIEKHLGHPLNHVLIQHYRNSSDYISEHSDKTLDIARGSYIANVSLGAERTMVLRTKRPPKDKDRKDAPAAAAAAAAGTSESPSAAEKAKRQIQRAPLPHNSLLRMGLQTNMRWLHAIRPDKRSDRDKSSSELAYSGARISLTFRQIGTFLNTSQTKIWGQGAVGKTKEEAQPVVNGQTDEAVRMLQAFGHENHVSEFDWEKNYGAGFNVLHMGSPKRFFAGSVQGRACTVENTRVALALADMGIGVARGAIDASGGSGEDEEEQSERRGRKVKVGVKFVDNDPARTEVVGDVGILRYLDAVYGAGRRYDQMTPAQVAKRFARLEEADELWTAWNWLLNRSNRKTEESGEDKVSSTSRAEKVKQAIREKKEALLKQWEEYAQEAHTAAAKAVVTPTASEAETKTQPEEPAAKDQHNKRQLTPFYICGGEAPSPADYALWPVLHELVIYADGDEEVLRIGKGYLAKYYMAFKQRSAVAKVVLSGGNTGPASANGGEQKRDVATDAEKKEKDTAPGAAPASAAPASVTPAAPAVAAEVPLRKTIGTVVDVDAGEEAKVNKTNGSVSVDEKVKEKM